MRFGSYSFSFRTDPSIRRDDETRFVKKTGICCSL